MRLPFLVALLLCAACTAHGEDAAQARVNYMLNCQGCHLPDGRGYPGKVPDIRHSMSAFLGVEGGREFLVRIPGAATSSLDDAQLAQLLNWMLSEFSANGVPADFVGYDATEAGRLRSLPLVDVLGERTRLAVESGVAAQY